jgi:RHS repeat-associated protein
LQHASAGVNDGTGLKYFLTDHPSTALRAGFGSIVAITAADGTLITQQRYLPFGGQRTDVTSPAASPTDFTYTGQRALAADMGGIMDYHARFYSPTLGRFLQPDTVTPDGPQGLNRYSYVMNNPVNFNDPTGNKPWRPREDKKGLNKFHSDMQARRAWMAGQVALKRTAEGKAFQYYSGMAGHYNSMYTMSATYNRQYWEYGAGAFNTTATTTTIGASNTDGGGGESLVQNDSLCKEMLSDSACQKISRAIGVGVLTLDVVAAIGTGAFALVVTISALAGPVGLGTSETAYQVVNLLEGWIGGVSFALTAANDFFITGDSYITKSETVLSSDLIIAGIFAGTGSVDPEPFGDTLINGTSAIHDLYRLTGGESLFKAHFPSGGRWYLTDTQ